MHSVDPTETLASIPRRNQGIPSCSWQRGCKVSGYLLVSRILLCPVRCLPFWFSVVRRLKCGKISSTPELTEGTVKCNRMNSVFGKHNEYIVHTFDCIYQGCAVQILQKKQWSAGRTRSVTISWMNIRSSSFDCAPWQRYVEFEESLADEVQIQVERPIQQCPTWHSSKNTRSTKSRTQKSQHQS